MDRERSLPHVLKFSGRCVVRRGRRAFGTYKEPSCGFTDAAAPSEDGARELAEFTYGKCNPVPTD